MERRRPTKQPDEMISEQQYLNSKFMSKRRKAKQKGIPVLGLGLQPSCVTLESFLMKHNQYIVQPLFFSFLFPSLLTACLMLHVSAPKPMDV